MRGEAQMTVPEVARVLGTRAAIGIGVGLLLASRFSAEERRSVGWTLLLAGAFSGAVLALELFGWPRPFTLRFGPGRSFNGAGARLRPARESAGRIRILLMGSET
jgi:hypothetical protein